MEGLAQGRSRRDVVFGALLGLAFPTGLSAQDATPYFGALRVDTRPLAVGGGGASAALIQRFLPGKMQSVFEDLTRPGDRRAPTLVARIDILFLSSLRDSPAFGFASSSMDSLVGAGVVLGASGPSVTPLRVTLPASYSGASYLPDIDARRIDSLCYQFAYWLRREMNL